MTVNQKKFFIIFIISAILAAFAILFVPAKAFFLDKAKVENELKAKTAEKDSLAKVLENMQNNPYDLEKEARNNGYAKKGETMLTIVPEDIKTKNKKFRISAFLIIASITVAGLIISFALPSRKPEAESD